MKPLARYVQSVGCWCNRLTVFNTRCEWLDGARLRLARDSTCDRQPPSAGEPSSAAEEPRMLLDRLVTILHISDLHRSRRDPVDNGELIAALQADRARWPADVAQ